ncbi:MAG: helix-turn-helix domain-containing protein [Deltaproteobacteria bacterium]|nr:helix-turn-helix domain-containing protein [Deltaproteobacteria bacterium]
MPGLRAKPALNRLHHPRLAEGESWSALPGEEIGAFLQRTREHVGIPLAQISFTTRIPVASLRLIEDGSFESLPGETFTRGFIRSYAGAIGLSPADAIRLFDGRRRSLDEPGPGLRPPAPAELRSRKVGVAFALLILIVVLTLILSLVLRGTGDGPDGDLSGSTGAVVHEVSS